MVASHFFKATPGRPIPSLHHRIHPMQVMASQCQRGETLNDRCYQAFVPIVWMTDDNPSRRIEKGISHARSLRTSLSPRGVDCVHPHVFATPGDGTAVDDRGRLSDIRT